MAQGAGKLGRMKVLLNMDSVGLKEKPGKEYIGILRKRLCNESMVREVTPEQLMEYIRHGYSFTPGAMTGTTGNTWKSQQVICADIDNDDEHKQPLACMLTPENALDVMAEYGIEPYFMYYSFSNKPEHPKFRVVLILDEPITDPQERADIIPRFIGIFNTAVKQCADTAVDDAARLFYGSTEDSIICAPAKTTKKALLHTLPEPIKEEPEKPARTPEQPQIALNAAAVTTPPRANRRRTTAELETELRADIEHFNLLEYIQQTTNSRMVKIGNVTYLNPCPICGHKDDFQVTGGLYHCYSKSGGTGGTIIDYLMNHDGLTTGAALDKFKFEIMRYSREEWHQAWQDEEALKEIERQNKRYEKMMATDPDFKTWAEREEQEAEEYLHQQNAETAAPDPEPVKDPIDLFLEEIKNRRFEPVKTDLPEVDRALMGGFLRRTIVTLAAAPGMGKTAFCQQLFEGMAAAGTDVLFLNLEMDRAQLLGRSISRLAWRMSDKNSGGYDVLKVLRGYEWTPAQEYIFMQAIEEYRTRIAPHFSYNPDTLRGNDIDSIIDAMQAETERLKAAGRRDAPIICIDYLQLIMAPGSTTAESIQIILQRLKEFAIHNDTVVLLVSAQNRAANMAGASEMESGRDTSGIEYTGDLMLGLVYTAIENKETWTYRYTDDKGNEKVKKQVYDLERIRELQRIAEEDRTPPDPVCNRISLKVLKNRFGSSQRRANFIFDGPHMTFYATENDRKKQMADTPALTSMSLTVKGEEKAAQEKTEKRERRNKWYQADFSNMAELMNAEKPTTA